MNKKKLVGYAGIIFLLCFVGSSSALIDLTGTYDITGAGGSSLWNRYGIVLSPATDGDTVQLNGTLDMNGENITDANLSEYAGLNVDWNSTNGQFDIELNSTVYLPFEVGVVNATVDTGDINSLFVANDGDSYNISELLNKDWVIYINYSDVTDFDFIILRQWYDASGIEKGHSVHPSLWDWTIGDWDEEYGDIFFQDHYKYVVRNVFDAELHIGTGGDLGKVRMRLWHDNGGDKGRPQHAFRLDYSALSSGFATSVPIDHDSLSNRNNKINHPWAMPTDGSRNGTGDFIFEENVTTTGEIYGDKMWLSAASSRSTGISTGTGMFMSPGGGVTFSLAKGFVMIGDGSITGVSIMYDVTAIAGPYDLELRVSVNGVSVWANDVSESIANEKTAQFTQARGNDSFNAGDDVQAYLWNNGGGGSAVEVNDAIVVLEVITD